MLSFIEKEYMNVDYFVGDVITKINALKDLEDKYGAVNVIGKFSFIRDVFERLIIEGYHVINIDNFEDGEFSDYYD